MKENLVRLKTILEERERVWNKTVQDYQHYRKNPPYTPDGNLVALETHVQLLFDASADLMAAFKEYTAALEADSVRK